MEIEIQHHALFCGTGLHQFKPLSRLDDLMSHKLEERESARWVSVECFQDRGFRINAHARRFGCHRVAMEDVGKQRGLDKEFAGRACPEHERASVERAPVQPQPPFFDEIDRLDFVALPEKTLVWAEPPPLKVGFVEGKHIVFGPACPSWSPA